MGERDKAPADATSEAVATTGLFSLFTAVIALAVCLAGLGTSDAVTAIAAGIIAALSFATGIVCFGAQARERAAQDVAPTQDVAPAQPQLVPAGA
jgi:F0F1-type ATP synthase assembly protein I